jgi:hypothetical protein
MSILHPSCLPHDIQSSPMGQATCPEYPVLPIPPAQVSKKSHSTQRSSGGPPTLDQGLKMWPRLGSWGCRLSVTYQNIRATTIKPLEEKLHGVSFSNGFLKRYKQQSR